MSNDLIIKSSSPHYSTLDRIMGAGSITGTGGIAVGIAGKAASIFCKKGSNARNVLSSVSSLGILTGALGFAALGTAYFLKDSVSEADILKQKAIVYAEERKDDAGEFIDKFKQNKPLVRESQIKYFKEKMVLNWLEFKKEIQQSIYSALGWKK